MSRPLTIGPGVQPPSLRLAEGLPFHAAAALALTAVAALLRALAQQGIPLYPDSFQFMLLAHGLAHAVPVDPIMGSGGDPWAIPFHRLGYAFFAAPFALFTDDPFAPGLIVSFVAGVAAVPTVYFLVLAAFRQPIMAIIAGLVVALSFSGVTWSRFPMSESLAIFLVALTMLLGVLAGRTRHPALVVAAGLAAALTVLVRLEMLLLLPTIALLLYVTADTGDRSSIVLRFLASWLVSLVLLATLIGWLAQDVVENFTLNPLYFLDRAFLGSPHRLGGGQFDATTGVWDFFSDEPILSAGLLAGLAWSLRSRDLRIVAIWPGLLALLAIYIAWNAHRHFAPLVPLLAYLSAFGFYHSGRWLMEWLRITSPRWAALASAALAIFVMGLVFIQVSLSESAWHPDVGYEYEVAEAIEERLTTGDLSPAATICAYSPEAYYLAAGLAARRLSEPDLTRCRRGDSPSPMVVVVDAAIRIRFGHPFESQLGQYSRPLFQISTSAPYLHGRQVHENVDPAVAYLVR